MNPADLVNRMNDIESEGEPAYYTGIAKTALWLMSVVLFGVVVIGCLRAHAAYTYLPEVVGNIIAAAQALAVICLAVLGYRRGRGPKK